MSEEDETKPVQSRLSPAEWTQGHRILAACVGAYFGVRFCQVIVGPVVPEVIGSFGVSRGAIGTALTGMWIVYAAVQVPSGVLGDRIGERAVVVAALLTTAVATLGLAVAPGFLPFGLAVVGLGIGAGIYYNPATMLLDRTAGDVGQAIGTHRIGGQIAGVSAPAGAAVMGLRYGWRTTVAVGAAAVAVGAVLFLRATRRSEPRGRSGSLGASVDPELLSVLLSRPVVRGTTVVMACVEFVGLAMMAFLPTLLIEHHGLGQGIANALFAVFFGVAAVSQPVAGRLSDRHGPDRTVIALAAMGMLGYAGLAAGGPLAITGPAVVFAGASMSATPVIQSRLLQGLEDLERGLGFGVFRTVYLLIGATGTAVVGTVADAAGWRPAIGLLCGLFAVVLLAVRRTPAG